MKNLNDTLDLNQEPNQALNQKLRDLIKETPVSFENSDKLRELGQALVSNDYFKKSTITKYK